MCGIAGIFNYNKENVRKNEILKMLNLIRHRGPDGSNIYMNNNVALGHVLLKIQDITDKSMQPFIYNNLVLIYSGEIYNYKELKKELVNKGYNFETDGDTEVLIKMIDCYGLDKTLEKIEGCFAFSIYDINTNEIHLVRDRFGIKPLYYYQDKERFIFCSEIKGILQCENIPRKFNMNKVLISLNCKLWIDQEETFFDNINCLKAGHYMTLNSTGCVYKKYYSLNFTNEYTNPNDLVTDFQKEFEESVKKKLLSKVPVAAFLSGGLDSSIVCKLLNDYSEKSLSTYTICYDFDNNLDLNHANKLAISENFNNHNILITEDMYNLENIDKVTYGVEEILIDKVYISMYFNYKAAKDDGYTVVVSGQGSDEVWLGYIFTWRIFAFLKEKYNYNSLINDYYKDNMIFKDKLNLSIDSKIEEVLTKYLDENLVKNQNDEINSFGDLSLKTILHDLLIQEDKIAMMNSIESRVPFVDNHKIVELAYKSSSKIKLFDGREKYIVRKYAKGKIDDSIITREKYPFPEPPKIYNDIITKICRHYWEEIKKSQIIKTLIKNEYLSNVDNFTELEQWWILVYWRFEKVFKVEV